MNEKDKNFAILSKLYELADEIWENVEDKRAGVFTASEIARSIKSCKDVIVCFGDLGDEQITVEVDSFKCSIQKSRIFEYIRIFERLAGVSDKKAKTFVCEDGSECVIKTLQNPAQNVESTHKADSLRLFGNVCEIFFNGQNCPLTFISGDASMGLVMPCYSEQYYELGESERHNPIELAKAARIDKKAAKVISSRPAKEKARKTPPTASDGKEQVSAARGKRFSFEAVGVNVGDVLSFIDGTEVVAVAGNKVEFCGEVFTLSGFCKEFMPDDKRTKSNSYRGCNFFFLDGVCLGKIFREVMEAAPDVPPVIEEVESVTLDIQRTDGIPENGHIRHEANNFEHKECEEKPNKGQTGRSDGKTALHPTVTPLIARKHNTGRFWPLFGRVGAMEATAARRVRAKVLRRRAPTFVAGRVRPPPYYAHNEGRMNSFRFYNNFKISKE